MTDARTPSDHHQDAQDALVEDRSMRPPNAMRYRCFASGGLLGEVVTLCVWCGRRIMYEGGDGGWVHFKTGDARCGLVATPPMETQP